MTSLFSIIEAKTLQQELSKEYAALFSEELHKAMNFVISENENASSTTSSNQKEKINDDYDNNDNNVMNVNIIIIDDETMKRRADLIAFMSLNYLAKDSAVMVRLLRGPKHNEMHKTTLSLHSLDQPHVVTIDSGNGHKFIKDFTKVDGKWGDVYNEMMYNCITYISQPIICIDDKKWDANHIFVWWYRWRLESEEAKKVFGKATSISIPSDEIIADNVMLDDELDEPKREIEHLFNQFVDFEKSNLYVDQILVLRFFFRQGKVLNLVRWPSHMIDDQKLYSHKFLFISDSVPSYDGILIENALQRFMIHNKLSENLMNNKHFVATQFGVLDPRPWDNFMKDSDRQHGPYYYK